MAGILLVLTVWKKHHGKRIRVCGFQLPSVGWLRVRAAADEGVDSCWLNFLDPDKLSEALGLPENEEVLMVMDLGYAADGAGPLANHANRKAISETVVYL